MDGARREDQELPVANEPHPRRRRTKRLFFFGNGTIIDTSHVHPWLYLCVVYCAFPPPPPPFLERCEVPSRLLSRVVQAPFLRGCRNFAHFIVLVLRTASRATRTSPRSIHERCASARRREGRAARHPTPSEEKKLSSSTDGVVTSQPNVVVGRLARVLDSSPPIFFCFDLFCCTSHSSCLHVALDRREASFRIEGWPRGPCVAMPCVPVRWLVRAGA